jgi:hypothetical protein
MRTQDFSHAPRIAQAGAMVTALTGVRRYVRARRAVGRAAGCCGARPLLQPPAGVGLVAWFETEAAAHAFVESLDGVPATVLVAGQQGYSNGVWRAESNVMAHIETFTPIAGEDQGPPVRRRTAPHPPA